MLSGNIIDMHYERPLVEQVPFRLILTAPKLNKNTSYNTCYSLGWQSFGCQRG